MSFLQAVDPVPGVSQSDVLSGASSADFAARQQQTAALGAMREAQVFNAAEAQKQRDWTERMSNSAVSRRMADLKASGLNPILAAGSAADVGSGASASSSAPEMSKASRGVSSPIQVFSSLLSSAALLIKVLA